MKRITEAGGKVELAYGYRAAKTLKARYREK